MANEGTIRIHRLIGGTGAAFRVSFVPYDSDGEGTAGVRSFHEVQQVRAFLKSIGRERGCYQGSSAAVGRGPFGVRAECRAFGRSREERGFGRTATVARR